MVSQPFGLRAVPCHWMNCPDKGTISVHGKVFCRQHEVDELRRIVLEGLTTFSLDEDGRPLHRRWLNCFARLVDPVATGGLTKGKIEQRAKDFSIHESTVHFKIERHPVGRVTEEWWAFSILTDRLQLLSERLLESDYELDESNNFLCPECKYPLTISPGKAVCTGCGYEDRHEHSYSW